MFFSSPKYLLSAKILKEYYNAYISRQLPIEFYRTFDSSSLYNIRKGDQLFSTVQPDIRYIDISYNMNLLRNLYGYLTAIYFSQRR